MSNFATSHRAPDLAMRAPHVLEFWAVLKLSVLCHVIRQVAMGQRGDAAPRKFRPLASHPALQGPGLGI